MSQQTANHPPHAATASSPPRRLNPRKLALSKWTAATVVNRERHFLVIKLVEPEPPEAGIERIEMEAILTRRRFILPWRALLDGSKWLHGWQ